MVVVDAQVHIWAAETPERPWIPGGADYAHQAEPLTKDLLLGEMDRVGVDRAFLVSPTWEGHRNDVVLDAVRTHPDRFGAIVRFDLADPANADRLATWYEDPHVYGARVVFVRQSREWLRDGTAAWFWPVAEQLGMPVMVFAPGQHDEISEVAAAHPALKIAVCHLGMDTSLRDEQIIPQVERMLNLASLPNVAVKASSLPSYVNEPFPFPSLHVHIEKVVDAFGPERVFWGSDLSRLRCDYSELYKLFRDELAFLSEEDRSLIMGRAICRWFGWELS